MLRALSSSLLLGDDYDGNDYNADAIKLPLMLILVAMPWSSFVALRFSTIDVIAIVDSDGKVMNRRQGCYRIVVFSVAIDVDEARATDGLTKRS